jgi:hypothetical protein
MGLDATPELAAIFLVYFVQGILGLSRLAVSYYFKDDLGLDPAELAIFQVRMTMPRCASNVHVCAVRRAFVQCHWSKGLPVQTHARARATSLLRRLRCR